MSIRTERNLGQWSYQARPGLEKPWQVSKNRIIITNITLPFDLVDKERSSISLNHVRINFKANESDPENLTANVALATLIPEKVETVCVNITLNRHETVAFEVLGNNTIHLSGHYTGMMHGQRGNYCADSLLGWYDMAVPPSQSDNLFDAPPPTGDFLSSASTRNLKGKGRALDNNAGPSGSGRAKRTTREENDEEEDEVVTARSKKQRKQ
ncbi:hypothetical protein BDZ89DRAFT_1050620 [Hymenopellis radicata]|nr:hypothetical protein BDZ89DRAFT_1050620 [Hymenopellis radicata]